LPHVERHALARHGLCGGLGYSGRGFRLRLGLRPGCRLYAIGLARLRRLGPAARTARCARFTRAAGLAPTRRAGRLAGRAPLHATLRMNMRPPASAPTAQTTENSA